MENPQKHLGLQALSVLELKQLRDAIEDELLDREAQVKKKLGEEFSITVGNNLKQVLRAGFGIILETDEAETELFPADAGKLVVTVYPLMT